MARVYNSRSFVKVNRPVTHGAPAPKRKPRVLAAHEWQWWKFEHKSVLNGRYIWDSVYAKSGEEAVEVWLLRYPHLTTDDIIQANLIGYVGK